MNSGVGFDKKIVYHKDPKGSTNNFTNGFALINKLSVCLLYIFRLFGQIDKYCLELLLILRTVF
jgi:hypothetical protein